MFIQKERQDLEYLFSEEFFYKDCSIDFLRKKFDPKLIEGILSIAKHLKHTKKYRTYDISYARFSSGGKTCVDPSWHCDGFNNEYLIYCKGDFRTKILIDESPPFSPQNSSEIRELNQRIAKEFVSLSGTEIDDSTPYLYNSQDIHKGRHTNHEGERFFFRVCESDYLKPKNFNLKRYLDGKTTRKTWKALPNSKNN